MRFVVILALMGCATLSGCGVNPVTGKKEIQFVSEAQELQIGAQNYSGDIGQVFYDDVVVSSTQVGCP